MARIRIPKNPGQCVVIVARAGNFAVSNNKSGKNKIMIPCRDESQAEVIAAKINSGDHDGEIWV